MAILTATLTTGAIIAGGATAVATGVGMYKNNKASKNAKRKGDRLTEELDFLENNMTEIINPWEGATDLSGMATDLSGMASDLSGLITDTSDLLSNPMANLSVSTAAAEMQAEEADIALANTLDLLASTGSSAGGATALAQAALQSKKGVAATIQQQEQANAVMEARGEQALQSAKMQAANRVQDIQFGEASRLQNIQMSEAARLQQFGISEAQKMQNLDAQGKHFMYAEERDRDLMSMSRKSKQADNAYKASVAAKKAQWDTFSTGMSSVGDIVSGGLL